MAAAMCFWSCDPKEDLYDYKDKALTGTKVNVPESFNAKKVFVLNEGQMGANNASLDVLRVSDGQYITGVWKKMNPGEPAGLGDVANDIVVIGNEVWITVNNSGYVEVISAQDETHIAAITVPSPRSIAFDDKYAYVSSYSGAYITYGADWKIVGSSNPKGHVYRIDLATHKLAGEPVEVGYQPEGLACYDGKLYVANSGGLASQLPPDYSYDNKVSVIDLSTFKVVKDIVVEINLEKVYYDGAGQIYVTSMGDFYTTPSSLWVIQGDHVKKVCEHVYKSCILGNSVYVLGDENELDYSENATHRYELSRYSIDGGAFKPTFFNLAFDGKPYGIACFDGYLFLADAGDYFNPGTLSMYDTYDSPFKPWTVPAGVCPAHFAIW